MSATGLRRFLLEDVRAELLLLGGKVDGVVPVLDAMYVRCVDDRVYQDMMISLADVSPVSVEILSMLNGRGGFDI